MKSALNIIELLRHKGAAPYVPSIQHNGFEMTGEANLDIALAAADCVVVVTDHSCYDWAAIRPATVMAVDTRHAMWQG